MTFSDDPALQLELQTNSQISTADLVQAVQDWLDLGLLDDAGIHAVLEVASDHPALLKGLERWLELGVLSELAVRQLCETHLVCAVVPNPQPEPSADFLPFDRTSVPEPSQPPAPRSPETRVSERSPQPSSWLSRIAQSLMAELSVLWVLLLGIALVVLSSGVIAAQQWQNVPPVGQYSILWVYTLLFGGIGLWLQRRPAVQLTAQALQWVAVLLLPINMVAIDRIGFANVSHWGIAVLAVVTLTGLTLLIVQRLKQVPRLGCLNYLVLSYLHWGWTSSQWAIAAVYGGLALTGVLTMVQMRRFLAQRQGVKPSRFSIGLLIYGVLVLLGRSLFIEQLPIASFALAIGLCGAFVAWNAQFSSPSESPTQVLPVLTRPLTWEWVGGGLILLGWLIAVDDAPTQAIALSGLGLWFFSRRYLRFYAIADWLMLCLIGIQLHGLVWTTLPDSLRQTLFTTVTQATGTVETPWAILGLVFLPLFALILGLTVRIHRDRPSPTLLHWLIFGFGTVLVGLSLASPATRTLNGIASTLLLGITTILYLRKDSNPSVSEADATDTASVLPAFTARPLIYLTHLAAVLTLVSCLDWALPTLGVIPWGQIVLVLALLEWLFSYGLAQRRASSAQRIIQVSAWSLGIWLAIASYGLFLSNAISQSLGSSMALGRVNGSVDWGMLWVLIPSVLTFLGSRATFPQWQRSLWLSTGSLIALPLLTITSDTWWLWSLAIAAGLMIVNSAYLQRTLAAAIALGFAITFIVASLLKGILGIPPIQGDGWLIVWVSLTAGLWGLRLTLRGGSRPVAQSYAIAADGWAIALTLLVFLDFGSRAFAGLSNPGAVEVLALIGLMGAIAFRHWQQATHWALVGLAIAMELLVVRAMPMLTTAPSALVVANIALGLGWIVLGERRTTPLRISWNAIPLGYALLALGFRLDQFAPWTGWTTLGIALILMGVGRRESTWNPLCYLGIATFSIGAYEIAVALAPESWGDRAVLIAAVSVGLLGLYRLGDRWIAAYLSLAPQTLTLVAHLYWLLGSLALIAAIPNPIRYLSGLALLTGFLLTGYALEQGRHQETRSPDLWVYLGIAEACGLTVYLTDQVVPETMVQSFLPWIGAIAAVIAVAFYLSPWETWGWHARPWRRAAVILPLGAIALTLDRVHPGSLLVTAGCYTLLAQLRHQVRLTYLSILLVNWAIAQWIQDGVLDRPMLYASLAGLSLLYLAQVEPLLQDPQQRHARHWVRCLGVGTICLFALLFHHESGIIPALVSLIAIFAGLILRTRAFLYVGTITFLLNAFYQLVILIFTYSLLKWIVGLVAGVALIWVAATFETRREQMGSLLRQWFVDLREWQ